MTTCAGSRTWCSTICSRLPRSALRAVVRAWFDRQALGQAMGLTPDQQILLTQTVGYPKG